MNAIVPGNFAHLPAHLQHLAAQSTSSAIRGGIKVGAAFHQISYKTSKWRLQDPQGGEIIVPTHHLDIIIVDANPNLSKVFYSGNYDPSKEGTAPDCWSDNGQTPHPSAAAKQSPSCATCPHNVWGSGVNAMGEPAGKACGDSKKIAVILAENPTGPVYMLRIPAASLKNLYVYAEKCDNAHLPLSTLVTRLGFDSTTDYPKIIFDGVGFADANQGAAIAKHIGGTPEIQAMLGLKESSATAPVVHAAIAAPVAPPIALPPSIGPAIAVAEGIGIAPGFPGGQPVATAEAAKTRKPRATKAAPLPPAPSNPVPVSAAPGGFFASLQGANTNPPAAQQVVVNPTPTTQSLDDLIAQAMKA